MTKISNQYSLTNILTADLANSRLGINNVSPTVALDVTGAGKFSGALTVTGGIIASAANGNIRIKGSTDGFLGAGESDNKLYLTDWTTGAKGLIINLSTGAATFSSSIAATTLTLNTTTADYAATITNVQDSSQGLLIRATDNDTTSNLLNLQSSNTTTGQTWVDRFTVTKAGNVGIGTSSPVATLSMPASTSNSQISTGSIEVQSYAVNNSWIGDNMYFNGSGFVARNTGYTHQIYFGTDAGIRFLTGSSSVTAGAASNATERMRINSVGDLIVGGTTAPQSEAGRGNITINGSSNQIITFTLSGAISNYIYHGGANGNIYYNNSRNNATTYIISYTNGVYLATNATSWTANSDIRLKNIISPIDSAVDKLSTLNPIIFSWKSDDTNKENIGLIAQDVKEVFPQVIDTNKDGFLGVRYVELVPVLVKAVQEQQSQIQEQKSQIQELSAKVSLLENK